MNESPYLSCRGATFAGVIHRAGMPSTDAAPSSRWTSRTRSPRSAQHARKYATRSPGVRNVHRGERAASGEGTVADRGDRVRDVHRSERAAAAEGIAADRGGRVREVHRGERAPFGEGSIADRGDRVRDVHRWSPRQASGGRPGKHRQRHQFANWWGARKEKKSITLYKYNFSEKKKYSESNLHRPQLMSSRACPSVGVGLTSRWLREAAPKCGPG